VETDISGNAGIGVLAAYQCDVTIRRSTIDWNKLGGLDLSNGTFVVTDTLIMNNGTGGLSGSSIGGAKLDADTSFTNNTVVSNQAKSTAPAGVNCADASVVITNSILSGNGSNQWTSCTFKNSNVYTGANTPPNGTGNKDENCLDTNNKPTANSGCVNSGDNNAASKLDRDSQPRISKGFVDMGAFELP